MLSPATISLALDPKIVHIKQRIHFSHKVLDICIAYRLVLLQRVILSQQLMVLLLQLPKLALLGSHVSKTTFRLRWGFDPCFLLVQSQLLIRLDKFGLQRFKLIADVLLLLGTFCHLNLLLFEIFQKFILLSLLGFHVFYGLLFQTKQDVCRHGHSLPAVE